MIWWDMTALEHITMKISGLQICLQQFMNIQIMNIQTKRDLEEVNNKKIQEFINFEISRILGFHKFQKF